VMLRSDLFGRATAWVGILANGLALLYFPVVALAPSLSLSPELAALPIVVSAPFRILWYVLIAVGLIRLSREPGPKPLAGGGSNRIGGQRGTS
jgi:predicted cobalt transporter CbtA